jgi:hypothetical protein
MTTSRKTVLPDQSLATSVAVVQCHQNDEEVRHQPQENQEYDHLLSHQQVLE